MRLRRSLVLVCLMATFACNDADQTAPFGTELPQAALLDGAHTGNPHFFLLPPLVKQPKYSGTFDGSLLPQLSVEICEWNSSACGTIVTVLTAQSSGSAKLRIEDGNYIANWDTKGVAANRTYRARFVVAKNLLGFADIKVVDKGSALKTIDANQYVGVVQGSTLPIKFRVELGAVVVIDPAQGGTVDLPGSNVTLDVPAGALNGTTAISVEEVSATTLPTMPDTLPAPLSSYVYQFGPDGTTFNTPVTLTIPYDPATLPQGVAASDLLIYTYSPTTNTYSEYIPVVDEQAHTLTAQIEHFSWFWTAPPALWYLSLNVPSYGETGSSPQVQFTAFDQNNRPLSTFNTWSVSDPSIIRISGNQFILLKPGTASINVSASYNGKTLSASRNITAYQTIHSMMFSADSARTFTLNGTAKVVMRSFDATNLPVPNVNYFVINSTCGFASMFRDTLVVQGSAACKGKVVVGGFVNTPVGGVTVTSEIGAVVSQTPATITAPATVSWMARSSQSATVTVTPAVAGLQVLAKINGGIVGSGFTDNAGRAVLTIPVQAAQPTTFPLVFSLNPNGILAAGDAVTQVTVLKSITTTTVTIFASRRDQPLTFNAKSSYTDFFAPAPVTSGTIQFAVDGTIVGNGQINPANAIAAFSYTPLNLSAGNHTVTATLLADARFESSSTAAIPFGLTQQPSALTFANSTATYGDVINLTATVSPAAAGRTITFARGATQLGSAQTDANGAASISYKVDVAPPSATLTASVPVDAFYTAASKDATLTVNKVASNIIVNNSQGTYGTDVVLSAQLNAGSGATVSFAVDGTPVGNAVTDANGNAQVSYSIAANTGSHSISASFAGNSIFNSSSATGTLTVDAVQLSLSGSVASGVIRSNTTATAQLTPAVSGVSVRFSNAGGGTATGTTDASGAISVQLPILAYSAGTYDVSIEALPTTNTAYASITRTVTVGKASSSVTAEIYSGRTDLRRDTPLQLVGHATSPQFGVSMPASGSVTFKIDGVEVGTTTPPAALNYDPSVLQAGNHTLTATFNGNDGVESSTTTVPFTLVGQLSSIAVTSPSGVYGSSVDLTATVTPAAAGRTVTFSRGGTTLGTAQTDASGVATLHYTIADAPGTVTITASVPADNLYLNASNNGVLTVTKIPTSIVAADQSAAWGSTIPLSGTLNGDPNGALNYALDGTNVSRNYKVAVDPGQHTVTIAYAGDTYHTASSASFTLTVTQLVPTITATDVAGPIRSSSATTTVRVTPAIAGLTVSGVNFTNVQGTTDETGTVVLQWPITDYNAGTRTEYVQVGGSTQIAHAQTSFTVTAQKAATTTIVSVAGDKRRGQILTFVSTTTFSDFGTSQGTVGNVSFKVDGVVVGTTTNNRALNWDPSSLNAGTHTVEAIYLEDSGFLSSTSGPVTWTLEPQFSFISVADAAGLAGTTVNLSATVNPAAAGRTVTFSNGGNTIGTAVTNASGVATITYTITDAAGDVTIRADVPTDTLYTGASGQGTLTVTRTPTSVVAANANGTIGQATTLSATLAPVIPGASINFSVGGTSIGSATVNSAGVATLSYTPSSGGSITYTAGYDGDATHAPSSGSATITVAKANTSISIPFLQTAPGTVFHLSATLSPAMQGKTLTFTVTDQTTGATLASGNATTNSSGVATFNWQTPNVIKRYDLTVRFNGDASNNSSVASTEIFVRN